MSFVGYMTLAMLENTIIKTTWSYMMACGCH